MSTIERKNVATNRTFRIDQALDEALSEEATKNGTSSSNLIERTIENYLNYYRWVEKNKDLILNKSLMRLILETIDIDTMKIIGEKSGSIITVEDYLQRGLVITEETAKDYILHSLGGYDNWFSVTYHNGEHPYFYIVNNMGEKWAAFLEAYISSFYQECLGKEIECILIVDNLKISI